MTVDEIQAAYTQRRKIFAYTLILFCYADDTQLHVVFNSVDPVETESRRSILETCVNDINKWMLHMQQQCRSKGNISGGARERRRREPQGGPGGILPQKILKSGGLEMLFPAFSKSYL